MTDVAAIAAVLAWAGSAAARTIKVGLILTYSGFNASLGEYVDKGLALYAKLHDPRPAPPRREAHS